MIIVRQPDQGASDQYRVSTDKICNPRSGSQNNGIALQFFRVVLRKIECT